MLTTVPLATSCLTETWMISGDGSRSGIVLGNPRDTSCWHASEDLSRTISPAICPFGYSSACDASSPRDSSETVWACCPTGFYCDEGSYSCLKDRNVGVTQEYTVTDIDALGNTITTSVLTANGINAHSIRVAFHSSDLAMTPLPTGSSYQATLTLTSTTSISPPVPDSATPSSGNLSIGATAGVGIGAGAGVLLLGVAGLAWIRYRKRKQVEVAVAGEDGHQSFSNSDRAGVRMGLSSTALSEMDGARGLYELEAKAAGKVSRTK
ncbi:hypothetical protein F4818DRAFT_104625 [Hypoxylon cercidicola]|nr:hypothetical protein F4818DRAFT_104625 [Hypoxylon cercidicola]